jgi:hypothetical protein
LSYGQQCHKLARVVAIWLCERGRSSSIQKRADMRCGSRGDDISCNSRGDVQSAVFVYVARSHPPTGESRACFGCWCPDSTGRFQSVPVGSQRLLAGRSTLKNSFLFETPTTSSLSTSAAILQYQRYHDQAIFDWDR